jgi:DNA transformation protein and related proteins
VPNSRDFIGHVLELLRPSRSSARAMFGGHGIYVDGLIVGLVVDDTLYLKTDDESRPRFLALDLPPFTYRKKTGAVEVTSYYRPPDEALESPDAMREWVRLATGAALRAAARKAPAASRARAKRT